MAAYGDTGPLRDYEYDHFIPLELGGATNDARNLWPEPGTTPNPKDAVEHELRRQVCGGTISLATAQREIVADWVKLAHQASAPAPSGAAATCSLTARYSSAYNDYDVRVESNQPDQPVTVSDALGHSHSWHTDGAGTAEVYFKSGGYTPGRRVDARVGRTSCSTTL
jgi:hypothetical protein